MKRTLLNAAVNAMLKESRKQLAQHKNSPIAKHARETLKPIDPNYGENTKQRMARSALKENK